MSQSNPQHSLFGEAFADLIRGIIREELHAVNQNAPGGDKLLKPEEAAEILGMSLKWLYRNAGKLPFTRKLGRKVLRFSHLGIQKYLAAKISLQTR